MNGKTKKQEYAAPISAEKGSIAALTLGVPGLFGEPVAGFHLKTD